MSLSSAIQLWEEWQLRILVLGSLFLQFFLLFTMFVRKLPALRCLRVLLWIAYLGNDALAIYALATLFNRYKKRPPGDGRMRSDLELVWAPVLLMHLGGQYSITAFSIEDNELWKRHVMTLVSQVTVALYVLCKWWSGKQRLLVVAVLLFVSGIISYSQKPWALRRASFNTMQSSTSVAPQKQGSRFLSWCNSFYPDNVSEHIKKRMEKEGKVFPRSLEEYVQEAKKCVQQDVAASNQEEELNYCHFLNLGDTRKKFVDLHAPYSDRIRLLESILKLNRDNAYLLSQIYLGRMFQQLYTKGRLVATPLGTSLQLLPIFMLTASLVLFARCHKDGYNKNDVWVTYILFCGTALQLCLPDFMYWLQLPFNHPLRSWHEMVSQYNILSFCAREKQPTVLIKLVFLFEPFKQYLNKHCYISQVGEALQITKLVHSHVMHGWNMCIRDTGSYRRFNNLRGQQTLWKYHQLERLGWSIEMSFDKSVLLWHIATSLCFHQPQASPQNGADDPKKYGMVISNYMIYLLFIHPEMLMVGTRQSLFTSACDEVQDILKGSKEPLHNEETIAAEITKTKGTMTETATATDISIIPEACSKISIIPEAYRLAEAVMGMSNDLERWTVIQGVWVEMLCYSAARCRGYLHARGLGEGGEYLSTVWLLWSYMGMETLAEMSQNQDPVPIQEEEDAAGA